MGILSDILSGDMEALITLLYRIPCVLIALTLHEVAHGYVAMKCGDPTAQMLGRLSLNPMKHLDLLGTLSMFILGFGWAKPVPVNPRNYRKFRRDDILVSFAGIAVNFCLFLLASFLMAGVHQFLFPERMLNHPVFRQREFLAFNGHYAGAVMMDHSNITGIMEVLQIPWLIYVQRFLMNFAMINISLAVFNLLPIPPLDGYHLLNDVIFKGKLHLKPQVSQIISMIFIGLLVFGVLDGVLSTVVFGVQDGIIQAILWIFGVQ